MATDDGDPFELEKRLRERLQQDALDAARYSMGPWWVSEPKTTPRFRSASTDFITFDEPRGYSVQRIRRSLDVAAVKWGCAWVINGGKR